MKPAVGVLAAGKPFLIRRSRRFDRQRDSVRAGGPRECLEQERENFWEVVGDADDTNGAAEVRGVPIWEGVALRSGEVVVNDALGRGKTRMRSSLSQSTGLKNPIPVQAIPICSMHFYRLSM